MQFTTLLYATVLAFAASAAASPVPEPDLFNLGPLIKSDDAGRPQKKKPDTVQGPKDADPSKKAGPVVATPSPKAAEPTQAAQICIAAGGACTTTGWCCSGYCSIIAPATSGTCS